MQACEYCEEKKIELKTRYIYGTQRGYFVYCPNCMARGPVIEDQVGAISCWNKTTKVAAG